MTDVVSLVPMRQLNEARCVEDDWTGLTNPAERRKRQNRLNLRAFRKRKAAQLEATPSSGIGATRASDLKHETKLRTTGPSGTTVCLLSARGLFIPHALTQGGDFIPMRHLYPISRDHLLPLIEYNVWRASLTNVMIMGHLHLLSARDCRFAGHVPVFPVPFQDGVIPKTLMPTPLQRCTPHADWIDILPCPRMRDNAIRTQHLFTNLELCSDMLRGLAGEKQDGSGVIIAWSNPWEPDGWEMTEGFIKKWGFLVEGCQELLASTNRWRDLRGEEPLDWEDESANV